MAVRPHAFVVMPFGRKPRADGSIVDFDRVYREYLRPALEAAGLQPFRADAELKAGEIRTDMFQELLLADMVVADLTVDNPNVWYEVGVRHALKSRGVVLVSGGGVPGAFDLYTDRKLAYGLKDGAPDPASVKEDIGKLVAMLEATMAAWHGHKVSPVYHLMPNLQEPDWKSLRIGGVRQFWEMHDGWQARIDLARKTRRIGDVLVLADEAPVAAFRADACFLSGMALRKSGQFQLALEQLDRGLALEPTHLEGLREKGMCLQRLALEGVPSHSLERARQHYHDVLSRHPKDSETWALLGRLDKDAWTAAWRSDRVPPENRVQEAAYQDALLVAAVDAYSKAFRIDPANYYPGINAVTLMHLYQHLTHDDRYAQDMPVMAGAVRFAARCKPEGELDFWAMATLADLQVLDGTPERVSRAYKDAIARDEQGHKDWFALDSCRAQLRLLQQLGFRPDAVKEGIETLDRALARRERPKDAQPRQVILFSGHMVDAPDRPKARFPASKEPLAASAIAAALERLGADSSDIALSQAAAGGDLLFIETCQQRGVRCEVMLPFPEPEFIQKSVLPSAGGEGWRDRFYAAKPKFAAAMRIMPQELGPAPHGVNPYERCNQWLLNTALASGIDKVRFICLWDGGGGDGPGGTAHMYEEVKHRTGKTTWLDTRTLFAPGVAGAGETTLQTSGGQG